MVSLEYQTPDMVYYERPKVKLANITYKSQKLDQQIGSPVQHPPRLYFRLRQALDYPKNKKLPEVAKLIDKQ